MPQERAREAMPEKRAVLILGMHRSGTSALARTINLLGAVAPKTLMRASRHNERGYWESEPLARLSEEILIACGLSWRSTAPMRAGAMMGHPELRRQLVATITSEFGDADTIILKDPRVTRLLPLYREVLGEKGYEILPVIALRNPLEVAKSLLKRERMSMRRAMGLWLRYTLDAEEHTRSMRRAVVVYEDLLADWRRVVSVMQGQIGGDWMKPTMETEAEVDGFLSADLRHHAQQLPSGLFGRAGLAGGLYREMEKLVANPEAQPAGHVSFGAKLSLVIP